MSRWQVGMVAMYGPKQGDREPCRLMYCALPCAQRYAGRQDLSLRWRIVIIAGARQGHSLSVRETAICTPTSAERQQYSAVFKEQLAL